MSAVFVDASYFIALFRPRDRWKAVTQEARRRLGDVELVTTDEILMEFLTGISRVSPAVREQALNAVQEILRDGNIRVVPQSRPSFLDGLNRFRQRLDKSYSLQDCISMNVMEAEGITDVLTSDHHFKQEGFTILMDSTS
ncbi:MAG: PIN domain-containing protein [Gemmatimonadota bacterium]|nr:PIN domain-containing protein [Gemmatimonadota bacterium]